MKTVTFLPTNAKNIKKFMKLSGINVLRCVQDKPYRLLITVKNTTEDVEKSIKFFAEYDLTRFNGDKVNNVAQSKTEDRFDFGSICRTEVKYN